MASPKTTAQGERIVGWVQTYTENQSSRILCSECGDDYFRIQDWSMTLHPITVGAVKAFLYQDRCDACDWHLLSLDEPANPIHPDQYEVAAAIMESWESDF